MAALIIAIFPQNSSRGNWEEQQDRTDPNSQFELARKPAWLLAFRQFGLPKWKHDFEYVVGMLVDTTRLLRTYAKHNFSEIERLTTLIEESLESYRYPVNDK